MGVVVVYVHGLWFGGGESLLLRRRLSRALGAQTRVFSYSSVRTGVAQNAEALERYLQAISADAVHLVAHSMGGLVVLELFERRLAKQGAWLLPPGRVVLTGSPVRGSLSAARLARLPLGRNLLGRTAQDVLLAPRERRWRGERELGVIAGELGFGLGKILGPLDGPNDGTVLVAETDLPGATMQLKLPVSHTGLVLSPDAARQVAAFLRDGRFETP
jgi:pimeloyl-ACP methyl ester carboxylesterase